jgi:hypothetical protein
MDDAIVAVWLFLLFRILAATLSASPPISGSSAEDSSCLIFLHPLIQNGAHVSTLNIRRIEPLSGLVQPCGKDTLDKTCGHCRPERNAEETAPPETFTNPLFGSHRE